MLLCVGQSADWNIHKLGSCSSSRIRSRRIGYQNNRLNKPKNNPDAIQTIELLQPIRKEASESCYTTDKRNLPFPSQEWSISNFICSLTRNITSHSMKNLAFNILLKWKMIIPPILIIHGETWKKGNSRDNWHFAVCRSSDDDFVCPKKERYTIIKQRHQLSIRVVRVDH